MIPRFRAWDKEENKMINWGDLGFFKNKNDEDLRVLDLTYFPPKFKNVKLMQSTGLKDNDGIEFYKKDIVRNIDSEELGVVEYDEGQFRVSYNGVSEQLWEIDKDLQIIGNIYENPELLEDN